MSEHRTCLQCGVVIKGRIDKVFCSDQCRNAHHNAQNRDLTNYIRNVNRILRKNRRILAEANPRGKSSIHKSKLQAQGFNFHYYTNTYQTKAGKIYYFCYDQGYLPLDNDYYALVVKQKYVV